MIKLRRNPPPQLHGLERRITLVASQLSLFLKKNHLYGYANKKAGN